MPTPNLQLERNFMEMIEIYPQIGIAFFDPASKLKMETYIDDPEFRQALVEFQRQRIQELERSGAAATDMVHVHS
jgi:hypothetical protein